MQNAKMWQLSDVLYFKCCNAFDDCAVSTETSTMYYLAASLSVRPSPNLATNTLHGGPPLTWNSPPFMQIVAEDFSLGRNFSMSFKTQVHISVDKTTSHDNFKNANNFFARWITSSLSNRSLHRGDLSLGCYTRITHVRNPVVMGR
jgi:hypothetical protein